MHRQGACDDHHDQEGLSYPTAALVDQAKVRDVGPVSLAVLGIYQSPEKRGEGSIARLVNSNVNGIDIIMT